MRYYADSGIAVGQMGSVEPSSFGELLRRYRTAAGLTQEELAGRAGLSARGVQDLERGLRRAPFPDTTRRLTDALGLAGTARDALLDAATLAASERSSALARPVIGALPNPLTSFVGRQAELTEIELLMGSTRLLTLTGTGGVGKTRLAISVAGRLLTRFADAVRFVDLAPLANPELVAHAVAVVVGVRGTPGRALGETLATALAGRQLLLILDNCEHVLEACAVLGDQLLRACPELHILATSRERLGVQGEVVWQVPSLRQPQPAMADLHDALALSEAGQLFVARARTVRPAFEVTRSNAPAIARVCRQLDGIPLALELAAATIAALTPETLAERLTDALRLLRGGNRTAPRRQQTLEATLDWSYRLLPHLEQVVLDRLAVFAGGFSLADAEAVCAGDGVEQTELVGLLVRLTEKSLVTAELSDDGAGRYRLLETVYQYGRERLAHREPDEATRRRHAEYYMMLAERAEPELWGHDQVAWQTRLEQSLDNMRVAVRWLVEHGDVWRAQRLGGALGDLWPCTDYSFEGRAWMAELVALGGTHGRIDQDVTPEPGAVDLSGARAKVLTAFGVIETFYGRSDSGRAALEECVALCRAARHWHLLSRALFRLGQAARFRRDAATAHAFATEGLEISRLVDDRLDEALNLYVLAGATADKDDLATAARLAEQCLALFASWRSPRGMALAALVLGGVRFRQGDVAAARARLEEALDHNAASHPAVPEVYVFAQLGWLAAEQGERLRARELFARSLRLERAQRGDATSSRDLVEPRFLISLPTTLLGCARLAGEQDQPERALRLAGAATTLRTGDGGGVDIVGPDWLGIDGWLRKGGWTLDRGVAEAAWADGTRMTPQQAIAIATAVISVDDRTPMTLA